MASTPSRTLKINSFPFVDVFRVITNQAENDPDLKRVLGRPLMSWKGLLSDKLPVEATADGPVMRFTPQPRRVSIYSAESTIGNLDVLVEFSVAGGEAVG